MNFVDVFTFYESCYALQISAAAAYKFKISEFVVFIDFEYYLSRAGAGRKVGKHNYSPNRKGFRK